MTTTATKPVWSARTVAGAAISMSAGVAVYSVAVWATKVLPAIAAGPLKISALQVPMAMSTAILFIALVAGLTARLRWPGVKRAEYLTAGAAVFASVVAVTELARARWGMRLPWDLQLATVQTTLGVSVVVGRMAVPTAVAFILASVSVLSASMWLRGLRWAAWVADLAALVGAFIVSQVLLGFAAGTPLAFERLAIPMAAPTAVAFLFLFAGIVVARRNDETTRPGSSTDEPVTPHNFDWRMASALSGLALVCVAVAFLYARARQAEVRANVLDEVTILADMRVREALAWRRERIGDTHALAMVTGLPESIARLSAGDAPRDNLIKHITTHRASYGYDQVVLYDHALKPVLVFPADSAHAPVFSAAARRAIVDTADVIVEDLHRGGDGKVHMDFIAPVRSGGRFVGAVQETIDAEDDFPLMQPWPVSERSVETELLRREGDSILLLSELRDRSGTALTRRVSATDPTQLVALSLASPDAGLVSGLDYRGVPVLGITRAVSGTSWVVLAKVDQAEAFAPVRKEASLLLFGMAMLTVIAALIVLNRDNRIARNQLARLLEAEDMAFTAETALRSSEERFRTLAESSLVGVFILHDGKYTYVNPAMAAILGYSVGEMTGMRPSQLVQASELERVARNIECRLTGELRTMRYELCGRHRDGSTRNIEVYGARMEMNGKPALIGTLIDISDRKQAEMALRESVERQRLQAAALEATVNAVMITDRSGVIEWVNPAFTSITGYTFSEAIGRKPSILKSGEQSPEFYRTLWRTIIGGSSWAGELVNIRKDGRRYNEEVTITPVPDEDGAIAHFVSVIHDVTERKSLEKQVIESQRLESIGLLASGIAHDLNNILSPISMSVGILRDKYPQEADMFDAVERSVDRGADIVRQVLTFARGMDSKRTTLRVGLLIKEISRLIAETLPRDIKLTRNLTVKADTVRADPTQVHQVVLNLVVNARDAMPDGGKLDITLSNESITDNVTSAGAGVRAGDYLVISVADSGMGMEPDTVGRIFEPFFTTKPLGQGTGLGLSTVHGIVRNHGGFIHVQSTLRVGTTFKVYLPLVMAEDSRGDATARPAVPVGLGECILVADDETGIRAITGDLLKRRGYTCILAENGAHAVAQFRAHRGEIKLVLLDRMMPVQGGESAAREIHAMAPEIPIILASGLLTADGTNVETPDLAELGIVATLPKPFTGPQLVSIISEHMRSPRGNGRRDYSGSADATTTCPPPTHRPSVLPVK